jgi:fibro-slime domain-containing protein
MVSTEIGADRKPVPVAADGVCWSSSDSFNKWFRDTPGENQVFPYSITAYWNEANKAYEYNNPQFFPLDNQGFGNEYKGHNFGFCYEIHSQFTYMGGESYYFMGDDDVWVFINDKLVVDLGGVHGPASGTVQLDSLGLEIGYTYNFDFFFCERHVTGSSMAFSTTVKLDPCGTVDTDGDGTCDKCDNCPYGDLDLKLNVGVVAGRTVSFTVALGTTVRNPVDVVFDFGDGETATSSISVDSSVSHTYSKQGTYTVTASVDASGCGKDTDSVDTKLGNRIAPSCTKTVFIPQ